MRAGSAGGVALVERLRRTPGSRRWLLCDLTDSRQRMYKGTLLLQRNRRCETTVGGWPLALCQDRQGMGNRRRGRRWPWIVLGLVVVVTAAGVLLWRAAGRSDPVTLAETLERFRAAGAAETASDAPAPGVYTYEVSGAEEGRAGPLTVRRDLPAEAQMTVTRSGPGWEAELALSAQHVEAGRYGVASEGVVQSWRRVDLTFAGFGRDDRRELVGGLVIAPSPLRVGQAFNDDYLAGSLRNRVRGRVDRREDVTVGAVSVPAYVIVADTATTGALSGSRRETTWWSPELRVPVRARVQVTLDGPFGYSSTYEIRLVALVPET